MTSSQLRVTATCSYAPFQKARECFGRFPANLAQSWGISLPFRILRFKVWAPVKIWTFCEKKAGHISTRSPTIVGPSVPNISRVPKRSSKYLGPPNSNFLCAGIVYSRSYWSKTTPSTPGSDEESQRLPRLLRRHFFFFAHAQPNRIYAPVLENAVSETACENKAGWVVFQGLFLLLFLLVCSNVQKIPRANKTLLNLFFFLKTKRRRTYGSCSTMVQVLFVAPFGTQVSPCP